MRRNIPIRPEETHVFTPHPSLGDQVNHNIVESEIEGGVHLDHVAPGVRLEIQTQHRWYTVINCGHGWVLISGHPKYCPQPLLVRILGSNWGGSMLKTAFIGRSMHLEFQHPEYDAPVITSRIREIKETPYAMVPAGPVDDPQWRKSASRISGGEKLFL